MMLQVLCVVSTYIVSDKLLQAWDLVLSSELKSQFLHNVALGLENYNMLKYPFGRCFSLL